MIVSLLLVSVSVCVALPCPSLPPTLGPYTVSCHSLSLPFSFPPTSLSINVSLTSLSLSSLIVRRILIVLNGGPGGSGVELAPQLATALPAEFAREKNLLIVLPDHRGTGFSAPLPNCPVIESPLCLTSLGCDRNCLAQYTTSNAARDLHRQLEWLRAQYPGATLHLHGISYGTMWANRYLALFGSAGLVAKVSMDGVLGQGNFFSQYTLHASSVAAKVLALCELDDACAAALAPFGGAVRAVARLYSELDRGSQACVNAHFVGRGVTSGFLRSVMFFATEMASDGLLKSLTVPLVYHLSACNVGAVETFLTAWKARHVPRRLFASPVLQSVPLGVNVVLSEIFLPPGVTSISNATLLAYYNASLSSASGGNVNIGYFGARSFWPRYERDEYWGVVGKCANCSILMLQGEMDLATPFEFVSAVATAAPERQLVSFPLVGHVTTALECPARIFMDFIASDSFPVDTTCVAKMPVTIDFGGQTPAVQQQSQQYFGCQKPFACR